MKNLLKLLSLLLAVLFLVTSLAACGGDPVVTDPTGPDTKDPGTTEPEPQNDREKVKDGVPLDLNFKDLENNTITFFQRDNLDIVKYEICSEEILNDTLYDTIHYRNIDVEERLGVDIKTIAQKCSPGSTATAWFEVLSTAVHSNSDDIDVAAIYADIGAPYALQSLYANLFDYSVQQGDGYIDLEKPWWEQSFIDNLNLYGNLFYLSGDLCISRIYGIQVVRFNKELFSEKFPEESPSTLYDLVDSGKWTIAKMTGYASQVWDDVNTNGVRDDGDTVGFIWWENSDHAQCVSWTYALDIGLMTRDQYGDYQIGNFNAKVIPAYELYSKLYQSTGSLVTKTSVVSKEEALTHMPKGTVLFMCSAIGDGDQYRNGTFTCGILPMPKYNEEQENYANGMWTFSTLLTIPSHLSAERGKVVSAVLEVMTAESYKQVTPVFYSKYVQGFYSSEEADARMYDIAIETCQYTFEQVFTRELPDSLTKIFKGLNKDIQQVIDSNVDAWPEELARILAGFEEME